MPSQTLELDVARLRRHIKLLRESLTEMVEKGEGCVTERDDCDPDCCRYGHARQVLKDTVPHER